MPLLLCFIGWKGERSKPPVLFVTDAVRKARKKSVVAGGQGSFLFRTEVCHVFATLEWLMFRVLRIWTSFRCVVLYMLSLFHLILASFFFFLFPVVSHWPALHHTYCNNSLRSCRITHQALYSLKLTLMKIPTPPQSTTSRQCQRLSLSRVAKLWIVWWGHPHPAYRSL